MTHPDPALAFDVYCGGRLDAVVHGAVAPFIERLRADETRGRWSLWMVRYPRRGEHLKLRLHGPLDDAPRAARLLEDAVGALFASLPPVSPEEERFSRPRVPAIDAEDEAEGDAPDRTLVRTRYRRSHVSLGPPPLLADDEYVARVVDALARGAELALSGLRPGDGGVVPGQARQRALLKALVGGLAEAGLCDVERARYLEYHRDWLLRFAVADGAREAEVLAGFDARIGRMRPAAEQLRAAARAAWEGGAESGGGPEAEWRRAVAHVAEFAAGFRGDPGYDLDPYSGDPVFPVIFKVFHGTANQLGLGLMDEAFMHHFLLRSVSQGVETAAHAGSGG